MENTTKKKENNQAEKPTKTCGIIMPIASSENYFQHHWSDVKAILFEAVKNAGFDVKLVSDDDAIGLIHERIVTNIYTSDMVICDVSSKNPNVMFELGMRLAFDKPTIIIKDDKTGYTFDAGVIEHLQYPSSLRFADIVKFKKDIKDSILKTYEKSNQKDHSSFLKSFAKVIVPAKVGGFEISENKYIIEELKLIKRDLLSLKGFRMDYKDNEEILILIQRSINENNGIGDTDKCVSLCRQFGINISFEEMSNIIIDNKSKLKYKNNK